MQWLISRILFQFNRCITLRNNSHWCSFYNHLFLSCLLNSYRRWSIVQPKLIDISQLNILSIITTNIQINFDKMQKWYEKSVIMYVYIIIIITQWRELILKTNLFKTQLLKYIKYYLKDYVLKFSWGEACGNKMMFYK